MMYPHNHNPETDQLAKRVFDRITTEHVTPRPRWEFLFKNYFFWALGALAVALGALAVSATIFELTSVEWQFALVTHNSLFSFILDAAPFLWLGALALFIGIGYMNVKKTNHGYRYPLAFIALGAVLTSLSLGGALYAAGLGGALEEIAGNNVPFHQSVVAEQNALWLAPERGLLSGTVVSSAPEVTSFVIRDAEGSEWTVDGHDLRTPDLAAVARGGVVRVVGIPSQSESGEATTSFHGCFAFPQESRGGIRGKRSSLPVALVASTSGRGAKVSRSEACKNIRPYEQLRAMDEDGPDESE